MTNSVNSFLQSVPIAITISALHSLICQFTFFTTRGFQISLYVDTITVDAACVIVSLCHSKGQNAQTGFTSCIKFCLIEKYHGLNFTVASITVISMKFTYCKNFCTYSIIRLFVVLNLIIFFQAGKKM